MSASPWDNYTKLIGIEHVATNYISVVTVYAAVCSRPWHDDTRTVTDNLSMWPRQLHCGISNYSHAAFVFYFRFCILIPQVFCLLRIKFSLFLAETRMKATFLSKKCLPPLDSYSVVYKILNHSRMKSNILSNMLKRMSKNVGLKKSLTF